MKVLIAILIAVTTAYVAYAAAYPTLAYRYKITIEVETSSGTKTGSSVLEVSIRQYPKFLTLGKNDHQTSVRGEAIFVDLGDGRNLIALLALGPNAEHERITLFAPLSFFKILITSANDVKWARELKSQKGRRVFAGDMRPTLVTFADLSNPSSIRKISFDNPSKDLGILVREVRSWIEITNDPVTSTLRDRIPWIDNVRDADTAVKIIRPGRPAGGTAPRLFKRT